MPDGSNITDEFKKELLDSVTAYREKTEAGLDENSNEVKSVKADMEKKFSEIDDMNNKARAAEVAAEEFKSRLDDMEKDLSLAHLSAKGNGETLRTAADHAMNAFMRHGDDFSEVSDFASRKAWNDQVGKEIVQLGTKGALSHEIELMTKALVAGSNPEGGFLIPNAPMQMIETKIFETSPIRSLSNIVTTGTDSFDFILDDQEADSGWVGEVAGRPDTDTPGVGEIKIPIHEIYAQPKVTQKMLDDVGFDLEGWLANKVSSRFMRQENTAFVTGDGAMKPKGFLDYTASVDANVYQRGTVGQFTATGTAGSLDQSDDLKSLRGLVKEEYQNNATWGMKRATWTEVTKLADSQGRYLFDIISNLRDGDIMQLLGRPVVLMNDMPDVTANALAVVYGDFREFYTIVDRLGIRVLRDPYTDKPYIKFYTTKRVGGAVTNYEAAKLLKINA